MTKNGNSSVTSTRTKYFSVKSVLGVGVGEDDLENLVDAVQARGTRHEQSSKSLRSMKVCDLTIKSRATISVTSQEKSFF